MTAPETFDQDPETGTVILVGELDQVDNDETDRVRDAVAACPVQALSFVER